MRLPQKVKLAGSLGVRHLSSEGPCSTHYISVINRAIPDIFAAFDIPPKCLHGDRKSLVYVRKCRHNRRSNLRDRSISALVGNKPISTQSSLRTWKRLQIDPLLLLRSNRKPGSRNSWHMFPPYFSGLVARAHVIVRIIVRGTMFDSLYRGR